MEFKTLVLTGTRAAQPLPGDAVQCFYRVNDEGNIIEFSDGVTWIAYSPDAGSGGLTLVEHKLITSDVQNYNLTGLDGNTDGIYKLILEGINGATGTSVYVMQPNSVSTNQTHNRTIGTGAAGTWATGSTLEIGAAIASHYCHSEITLYARCNPNAVARSRFYSGNFTFIGGGPAVLQGTYGGRWLETSTNITSLLVGGDQVDSLKSGSEIFLYKYAQG